MTFWEKVSQFGFEILVFIVLAVIALAWAAVWTILLDKGHKRGWKQTRR